MLLGYAMGLNAWPMMLFPTIIIMDLEAFVLQFPWAWFSLPVLSIVLQFLLNQEIALRYRDWYAGVARQSPVSLGVVGVIRCLIIIGVWSVMVPWLMLVPTLLGLFPLILCQIEAVNRFATKRTGTPVAVAMLITVGCYGGWVATLRYLI